MYIQICQLSGTDLVMISKCGIELHAPCIFSYCITFVFDRFGNCFTRYQVSLFAWGFTLEFMFKHPITDLISLTFLLKDIGAFKYPFNESILRETDECYV